MNKIAIIFILFFCQFAQMLRKYPFNYAARYGYLSDAQIHWEAASLKDLHMSYESCSTDPQYRYIQAIPPNSSLKAVILCNIHARQLISAEICLNWLKQLSSNAFAKKYKILVFLIGNKNRQKFIENQASCQRKNENGVDLNRNFPTDFNHFNVPKDHQLYSGNKSIDQPLTICLDELLAKQKVDLFIDVHSGMNDSAFYQQGVNNSRQKYILNSVKNQIIPNLRITTLKSDNEYINGHIFADLKVRKNVSYSLLFQTFLSNHLTCFLTFNPIGQKKKIVIKKYVKAMNRVFELVSILGEEKSER